MKRKLLVFALIFMLVFAAASPAVMAVDPAVRHSVVVVSARMEYDNGFYEDYGWGSGFFVGTMNENPTYLLTNHHVIEDFIENGSGDLQYFRTTDGDQVTARAKIRVYYDSSDYEEAYLVGYDEIMDIALLRLDNPTSKRSALPLQSPKDDMVGSTVSVVGFPGLAENMFADSTTKWDEQSCSIVVGHISRLFTQSGTGQRNIQVDCDIKHGNSGGPLVNEDGAAIGIAAWGVSNNNNESLDYAINIDEAIPILKQYSVDFVYIDPNAATPRDTDETQDETTQVISTQQEEKSPLLWIIIGIVAVIVIALVVVLILVSNSKKKAAQQQAQQAQLAAQQRAQQMRQQPAQTMPGSSAMKRAYVRSLSAQHRGSRVAVQDHAITLGRSQKDCALVYQDNTPGVSSRHCSLTWNGRAGEFILIDLGSTYGTYLENGQKLTSGAEYHLRAGDRFYLGEPGNMLILEVE